MTLSSASLTVLACFCLLGCEKERACDVTTTISGNHGHTLLVPKERLQDGKGSLLPLRGGTHEHVVPLRDADIKAIAGGQTVTTRASSVNAHTHEVTLSCDR